MRTQHIRTRQVHYVPPASYHARNPFSADVVRQPWVNTEYVPQGDDGLEEADNEGHTAQNGFRGPVWLYCSACLGRARQDAISEHVCQVRGA